MGGQSPPTWPPGKTCHNPTSHRPNEPLYTHHPHTRTPSPTSPPPPQARGRAVGPSRTESPERKGQLGGNVHVRVMNQHAIVCIVKAISCVTSYNVRGRSVSPCVEVNSLSGTLFSRDPSIALFSLSLSLSLSISQPSCPLLSGRPRRVQHRHGKVRNFPTHRPSEGGVRGVGSHEGGSRPLVSVNHAGPYRTILYGISPTACRGTSTCPSHPSRTMPAPHVRSFGSPTVRP